MCVFSDDTADSACTLFNYNKLYDEIYTHAIVTTWVSDVTLVV